jgi:hypothetical protein
MFKLTVSGRRFKVESTGTGFVVKHQGELYFAEGVEDLLILLSTMP